jgi:hypothetical protein
MPTRTPENPQERIICFVFENTLNGSLRRNNLVGKAVDKVNRRGKCLISKFERHRGIG